MRTLRPEPVCRLRSGPDGFGGPVACHPHISQDLQRRGRGDNCLLTTAKRSHSCAQGIGVCEIARRLQRAPSTISRELRRNAATRSGSFDCCATTAQWHPDRAARRPKGPKLASNDALRQYVQQRLSRQISDPGGADISAPQVAWSGRNPGRRKPRNWAMAWSPEQTARRLPLDFPEDQSMRISHEAIYHTSRH